MFKNKLSSAVIAIVLTVALLFSVAAPTFAFGTASVGSIADDVNGKEIVGQDVDQGKQTEYSDGIAVEDSAITEDCDVYATVPNSDIVVTVPKVQILDGKAGLSNSGVYKVEVRGDISANTVITVSPLDEMADREGVNFEMSSAGKDNIPTDVEQERTAFTYADGVRPDSPATTTGVITAYGMTAGIWKGDFQFNIGAATRSLTADELDERYDMLYYSALNKAVTDVNNDTIGENVDVPKDQAVAAVYTDENGETNVVLLKDSIEEVTTSPNVDMTINLAGNTLSVNAAKAIEITGGDVTIDGRAEGSSIVMDYDGTTSYCVNASGGKLTVYGGTFKNTNNSGNALVFNIKSGVTAHISDCNVEAKGATQARGISSNSNSLTTISNCNIDVIGTSDTACYGIYTSEEVSVFDCTINASGKISSEISANVFCIYTGPQSKLVVENCDITATGTTNIKGMALQGTTEVSNTNIVATAARQNAIGIATAPSSSLTLNNCNIKAHREAVALSGELYVNGGTYEGYQHGGFYFSGSDTVAYVENATIKHCNWFGEYEKPNNSVSYNSAFYIGGGNYQNIKVYMNNCDIWTWIKGFTLRSGAGEANNSLYISNSKMRSLYSDVYGEKGDTWIRIDNANPPHKLFIGKGCNFTADDINGSYGIITQTDEVYTKP